MSLFIEIFGETIETESREMHAISRMLLHIEQKNKERHKQIMSALSDLQDAVQTLGTNVAQSRSAVLAAIADIQTLPANDAALVPLTAAVSAAATDLADQAKQLLAAITPPAPAPAP